MKHEIKTGRPRSRQNVARSIALNVSAPCSARFQAVLAFEREGGSKKEVVSLLWRVLEDAVTGTIKAAILEKLQVLEGPDPSEPPKPEATSEELFAMAMNLNKRANARYWEEFHAKFGEQDLLSCGPVKPPVPPEPPADKPEPQAEPQDPEPEPKPVPAPVAQPDPPPASPVPLIDVGAIAAKQYLISMRQRDAVPYSAPEPPFRGYSINWGVPFVPAETPDSRKPAGDDPWQAFRSSLLNPKD
jgi:hypothetical protein